MQGILPVLGGLILFFLGGWSVWLDYDVATDERLHDVDRAVAPLAGRRRVRDRRGGRCSSAWPASSTAGTPDPAFFKKQTLTRATPTLVPDE